MASLGNELTGLFITSQAAVHESGNGKNGAGKEAEEIAAVSENGLSVKVFKADGVKCARCWKFTEDVGKAKHDDLCVACSDVVAVG